MKICIFGAGAIGGLLGAKLARGRARRSRWSRAAPHLAAIRANGPARFGSSGERAARVQVAATDDAAEARRRRTYVIVTLKAHSVPPAAPTIAPLLGPRRRRW